MAIGDAFRAGFMLAQQGQNPDEQAQIAGGLQAALMGGGQRRRYGANRLDGLGGLAQLALQQAQPYLQNFLRSGQFSGLLQQAFRGAGPGGGGAIGGGGGF